MKIAYQLLRGRTLDASFALGIALLVGRLSGLARELLLARTFGVSTQADVAILLLTLPDLLVGLLLAGGLSAALVPRLRRLEPDAGAALFRGAAWLSISVFALIGALLALFPGVVFTVLAPGIPHPFALAPSIVPLLVAVALPMTAASGVVSAFLNARDRYFVAGLGTLIFNLTIIAGLALGGSSSAMLVNLAVAIAAGAMIRLASQVAILPRAAWQVAPAPTPPDGAAARAFAAGVAATGLALLAPVLVRATASLLGGGTVAAFNYAQKLTELPVGILISTMSTVALTTFSTHIANGEDMLLAQAIKLRVRRGVLVGVTVAAFGALFAPSLVRVLLSSGAMNSAAIDRIVALTQISLVGVPFVAISGMATALLNARLMTRRVLLHTGIALAALPLLMVPGILLDSDRLLMVAVVSFQGLLALLLARAAQILIGGENAVGGRSLMLLTIGIIAAAAVVGQIAFYAGLPDWIALTLAGLGFAATLAGAHQIERQGKCS